MDIIQEAKQEKFRYVLSRMPTAACKVYLSVSIYLYYVTALKICKQ